MILYVNSCIRDNSRTAIVANSLLKKLNENYEEVNLAQENITFLDKDKLNKRTKLVEKQDYSDPIFNYAKHFAKADCIVIAAPFWDLSFPAILKCYIENVSVDGITFKYGSDGTPIGLCKAREIYYVTTAGGMYIPDYSFGYFRGLADFFGIPKANLIKAEFLDIYGNDPDSIVKNTIDSIIL